MGFNIREVSMSSPLVVEKYEHDWVYKDIRSCGFVNKSVGFWVLHIPTRLCCECRTHLSQPKNKAEAKREIEKRLEEMSYESN